MKRVLALILVIIMVFCSIPLSVFAESLENLPTSDNVNEATNNAEVWHLVGEEKIVTDEIISEISEITSLREENVKHFRLSDGTYEAVVYSEPIHRKDENGVWQNIDNNIELTNDKSLSRYSTHDSRVTFSATSKTNSDLLTLSENGYSISMKLLNDEKTIENDKVTTQI